MAYDFNMNDLTDRQRMAVAMDGADGLRNLLYGGRGASVGREAQTGTDGDVYGRRAAQMAQMGLDRWGEPSIRRLQLQKAKAEDAKTQQFFGDVDATNRIKQAGSAQSSNTLGLDRLPLMSPIPGKSKPDTLNFADGKSIQDGVHTFGMVQGPGGPREDAVGPAKLPGSGQDAMLSDGEAVIPARTVNSLNNQFFSGDTDGVEKYTLLTNQPFGENAQGDLRRRVADVGGPQALSEFQNKFLSGGGTVMKKQKSGLRKLADGMSLTDSAFDSVFGQYSPESKKMLADMEQQRKKQEDIKKTAELAAKYKASQAPADPPAAAAAPGNDTTINGAANAIKRRHEMLSEFKNGKPIRKSKKTPPSALRKMMA